MLQQISTSAARRASAAALTALLLLLSGCDQHDDQIDYGGGPSGETVSGTAAVGLPIVGGSVGAKCQNGSAPRSATTNSSGRYSFVVPSASFPCVLRVSGGTVNGTPNTQNLHSFATGGGTANVTPLTDLALALSANTAAGQSLAQWFDTPSNWSQVSSGLTAALNTLRQGLIDAGYDVPANWTAGSSAPLSSAFTPNPATDPYDALLEAIAEAIENSGTYADYAALLEAFASGGADLPEVEEEEPTDPEDAAGLELVALYAGTYTVNGNTRGTVTVAADGATIDFDTGKNFAVQGGNVYNRIPNFPSEPRVQIELFPAGQPQQRIRIFVDPADTSRVQSFVFYPDATSDANATTATVTTTEPEPELPAPNGNGSALDGSDGATGTLNGTIHTYTSNTGWSSLMSVFAAYGGDALTLWTLGGVPATVGTHNCKSNGNNTLPRIQLVVGGVNFDTAPTGGACRIEVQSVANDTITGRFSATLVNAEGQVVGTVTDGYFRKSATTGGGTLPAGQAGASFVVDGVTYQYSNSMRNDYNEFPGVTVLPGETTSPGNPLGIQIHTLPTTPGAAICDQPADGSNQYRKTNVWFYWNGEWYYAGNRANPEPGPTGSSCSVNVGQVSSEIIEGSFSGTFVTADGSKSITVSNGLFRYLADPPTDPDPEPPVAVDDGALDGRTGATGTLNGTTRTHTGTTSWYNGNFSSYQGLTENWEIYGIPMTPGTYSCNTSGELPRVRLILGNQYYSSGAPGGSCTLEVISVGDTHVEGRFTATLHNAFAPHALIGTVSDGFFRKRP